MSKSIKIRKGVDIKLKGAAEKVFGNPVVSSTVAINPPDFHGLIPKMLVKPGEDVKAGQPIFQDKYNERIKFVAPVSGEVADVVRGEKRRILEVRILADKEVRYADAQLGNVSSMSREQIVEAMLNGGLWPFIRQRPYAIIANPDDTPKAVFISAFDSHPLAPDYDFIVRGQEAEFQAGLDVVAKLANGNLNLQVTNATTSPAFLQAKGATVNKVNGPHPAGNVGVQIHHIDPINKGERVWYLEVQDVITIGRYFSTGKFDSSRVVALAGTGFDKPRYVKAAIGTCIKDLVADNAAAGDNRLISGNVLTGTQVSAESYLGFYDSVVTSIGEGREPELFGWALPSFKKFSLSRAFFFSWMTPNKEYDLNTNMHGEKRAFVVTGQYDKVMPMDILPVHLVKAIMVGDIEAMENLGIYEVAPEDFALCEFACTSKIPVQSVVREGLDLVHKECG